jgi:hypothetical protein
VYGFEVISVVKRYIVRGLAGLMRLIGGEGGCGAGKAARIVLAVIYLYVTSTVPLTHDCIGDGSCPRHCHLSDSNHCCDERGHCGAEEGASFDEHYFSSEGKFAHGACLACLYSATAKTPASALGVSLVILEAESRVQAPKDSDVTKSFGWLCSHPLRGPPGITS